MTMTGGADGYPGLDSPEYDTSTGIVGFVACVIPVESLPAAPIDSRLSVPAELI